MLWEEKDVRAPIPSNGGDWITKFGEPWKTQISQLQQAFGSDLEEVRMPGDFPTDVPIVYVKAARIVELPSFMKSTPGFEYNFLADMTASDEGGERRFEVIYNLYSTNRHWRIRVKVRLREDESIPTAIPVWKGANWAEREVFDMYGIKFDGHPDLRRILNDTRFEGYALRKDYPLRAYQIFPEPEAIDTKLLEG